MTNELSRQFPCLQNAFSTYDGLREVNGQTNTRATTSTHSNGGGPLSDFCLLDPGRLTCTKLSKNGAGEHSHTFTSVDQLVLVLFSLRHQLVLGPSTALILHDLRIVLLAFQVSRKIDMQASDSAP